MGERIIVAGASGLIGSELTAQLRGRGDEVLTLVRRPPERSDERFWNPERGFVHPDLLAGASAVISLNGASVGRLPWTASYRKLLRHSRLTTTRTLANAIIALGERAPEAWLSASASGFYGSSPGETLTESSTAGDTFLAQLCVDWESEARKAVSHTRLSLLRTAPIIHPDGVLKPMMKLTRFGLGGPLGRGTQHWPWISLADEVRGIMHTLDQQLEGPINLTGPTIATANEVGRALAHEMRRPYRIPAPQFALKAVLGKDATESLLTSDAKVLPARLLDSGFDFKHPTPVDAIRESLQ